MLSQGVGRGGGTRGGSLHRQIEERILGSVVLVEEVAFGYRPGDLFPQQDCRFVGPTPRHVVDGVSSTSQDECGAAERLYELDARRMAPHGEIKYAQSIPGERIGSALKHHRLRVVHLHDLLNHRFEAELKRGVVQTVSQREVYRVPRPLPSSHVVDVSSAGEEVAVFVERAGHHARGVIKGLLHTVPVVNVDVDVQNALVNSQQLQNREGNVVGIAKPARLGLLRVVETSRPVYRDVGLPRVQSCGPVDGGAARLLTKLEETVEDRAIGLFPDVESRGNGVDGGDGL